MKRQKNISDPSYREGAKPATRFKGEKSGGTINTQMREASQDLGGAEQGRRQVDQRKRDRDRMREKGLNVREERGVTTAFQRGSQVQHRIDPKNRNVGQESGRIARFSPNLRPSQRVHPKDK